MKNYCYLDFETDTVGRFYLAGIKDSTGFKQIVLNEELEGFALKHNLPLDTADLFIYELLEGIYSRHETLVAYSQAEMQLIIQTGLVDRFPRFGNIPYLNLRTASKKWIRDHQQTQFDSLPEFRKLKSSFGAKALKNSLASIMRLSDFQAPLDYAPGRTTARFNAVISGLKANNQDYESLTSVQKAKATKVLKHNRFDVEALPVLQDKISQCDNKYLVNATSTLANYLKKRAC